VVEITNVRHCEGAFVLARSNPAREGDCFTAKAHTCPGGRRQGERRLAMTDVDKNKE
jgi:hypothetical protein